MEIIIFQLEVSKTEDLTDLDVYRKFFTQVWALTIQTGCLLEPWVLNWSFDSGNRGKYKSKSGTKGLTDLRKSYNNNPTVLTL